MNPEKNKIEINTKWIYKIEIKSSSKEEDEQQGEEYVPQQINKIKPNAYKQQLISRGNQTLLSSTSFQNFNPSDEKFELYMAKKIKNSKTVSTQTNLSMLNKLTNNTTELHQLDNKQRVISRGNQTNISSTSFINYGSTDEKFESYTAKTNKEPKTVSGQTNISMME